MSDTLPTSEQWASELGVLILDPDGWRVDGKSMTVPITREEFMERLLISTIRIDKPEVFDV